MRGLTSELLIPKKKMADCMSSPNFNREGEKIIKNSLKPKRFFPFPETNAKSLECDIQLQNDTIREKIRNWPLPYHQG